LWFVSKYLSLWFVALIRYYVIVSIFFVIIILLSPPWEMINETSTLQNVFVNGWLFIWYSCLVIIYFKKLNKTEK
jgi:hypothetical protein